MIAMGVSGIVGMAALLLSNPRRDEATPSHPTIRRLIDALSMYKPLDPTTHTKLVSSMKTFEAYVTSRSTTLQTLRASEDIARSMRQRLASMDVSVRAQSHNNAAAILEFSEISNELLDMCEAELSNLHAAYEP